MGEETSASVSPRHRSLRPSLATLLPKLKAPLGLHLVACPPPAPGTPSPPTLTPVLRPDYRVRAHLWLQPKVHTPHTPTSCCWIEGRSSPYGFRGTHKWHSERGSTPCRKTRKGCGHERNTNYHPRDVCYRWALCGGLPGHCLPDVLLMVDVWLNADPRTLQSGTGAWRVDLERNPPLSAGLKEKQTLQRGLFACM